VNIMEDTKQDDNNTPSESAPSVAIVKDLLPDIIPVVPLTDRPAFPRMMRPVIVENQEMVNIIIEAAESKKPQYLGLVFVRTPENEEGLPASSGRVSAADLHKVGAAAKVVQIAPPQEMMPFQILVQVMERFEIVEFVSEEPVFRACVKYWYETVFEKNEELKAYSVAVVESIKELVKLNPLFKEGLTLLIERINVNDPGALCDFAASLTTATGEELQRIMEIKNIRTRIEEVLIILKRELEISKLKIQISKRIEERLSKQQREFFLKQQLKEIKKELGLSKDDAESEIEKFQKRIKKLTLTEESKERIDEEIQKMKLLEPTSPEFNVSRNYLDWLTVLPWGVYTEDNYDIKNAETVLNNDHYGLKDVKDRILELISVGIIKGTLVGTIILLECGTKRKSKDTAEPISAHYRENSSRP
jgi:ATP-dependent Lon protease